MKVFEKKKKITPYPQTSKQITKYLQSGKPVVDLGNRNAFWLHVNQSFELVLPAECNASDNMTENACFESWLLCKSSRLSRRASSQLELVKSWKNFLFFE